MSFRRRLLLYILVPLCIYAVATAYVRFMVAGDYVVEFEGECDPITESCFVGCADDACAEVYYYTWIQREAGDVYAQCGPDVLECPDAGVCHEGDHYCEVRYCSEDTVLEDEICDTIDASSIMEEDPALEEDELLSEPTPV